MAASAAYGVNRMRKILTIAVLTLTLMMVTASMVDASALRRNLRYDQWRDTMEAIRSAGAANEAAPKAYDNRYTGSLVRRGVKVYSDIAAKAAEAEEAPTTDLLKYYQRLKNRDYLKVYGKLAQYGNEVQKAPRESAYRSATRGRQGIGVYVYKPFSGRDGSKSTSITIDMAATETAAPSVGMAADEEPAAE